MAISLPIPPVAADAPPGTTAPVKEESKLHISVGGKELIAPAAALFAPIFETDPLMTYFLNGLTREQRNAYLPRYFTVLLTAAGMNKASFYHTDMDTIANSDAAGKDAKATSSAPAEWRSAVVLLPPGSSIDNPLTLLPSGLPSVLLKLGLSGVRKMLFEFEGACKAARKAGLRKGEDPYYVFFVGTAAAHQGRGLGGEVVREVLGRARGEGRTVWLEATTGGSRRLYERLGFEVVREIVLGEGSVGGGGEGERGGEGVRVWAMVWRPEKKVVG
ncbi:hypothetical protein VE03_09386 [Pseudogymnoascus sp. 23342-1-I1]|nr:hypothetical protein VE03_09386 [Pseudogymnoascus sp. 23342-1-I1]